ncbi:MAG: bifunctional precorrin-2 dehydrogenase/sirohydrochlorin ferrochelatase [Deltaproteobacteria bacterium]|nr:bifunctional precorrin-2 dehydrogenase/sirohydrochlorin ferrochelatase [Deltaproteobacteria bacterium]
MAPLIGLILSKKILYMPYYPIFLDLNHQNVVVVGGGDVAERKIKNLLTYGCKIYISSPHLTPHLKQLAAKKTILHIPYESLDTYMDDTFMVIAATDDTEVNSKIASQAKKHGLLINTVDQPKDCNFIMPSIVKRGNFQIAISTAGKSPALAKKIRKNLENTFPPEYDSLTELLGIIRTKLLSQDQPSSKNKIIFQQLVDSNLLEMITHKNWDGMRATLKSILGEGFAIEDTLTQVFKEI